MSIDCGAHLNGWCGDAAVSFIVDDKNLDDTDVRLIEAASEALTAGITAARPGARLGDISHAIGALARERGYGLMHDHGGHGVGRASGRDAYRRDPDGWTLCTADGSRAAHVEHTIAITDGDATILTAP